jgi:hypothetical protein
MAPLLGRLIEVGAVASLDNREKLAGKMVAEVGTVETDPSTHGALAVLCRIS